MLVRRGLTLYWRWPCIWRFVFIGVDGTPRLGFVYMCDYDEREVYEFSFGCSAYIRRPLFCCSYIAGLCSSCTKTLLLINFAVKKNASCKWFTTIFIISFSYFHNHAISILSLLFFLFSIQV